MPKDIFHSPDYHENELRRAALHNLPANPTTTKKGLTWFDNALNVIKYWDGTAVKTVPQDPGITSFAQNIGDGTLTTFTVTHNLGTLDVNASVFRLATPFNEVEPEIQHTSANVITLLFSLPPTAGQFRVFVRK